MPQEVEGFIVTETPYGESSKIINVLTREKGLIGIMCKGAKKMKSPLRACTQILTYGVFNLQYKEGKLSNLISVDVIDPLVNIRTDLDKISVSLYLTKLIAQVVKQNNNPKIYDLFIKTILKIEANLDPLTLCNILELKLLPYLGVGLNLDSCIRCGKKTNIVTIDASYGGLICKDCYQNEQIIDLKIVKLIRMYYYIDIESINTINVDNKIKKIINKFVTDYYDSFTGLYIDKKMLVFGENR